MVNWIVSSTVLILIVISMRFFLKGKISLRFQYALWAIVMVRLLIPISIGETAISVGNWVEQISQKKEVHDVYEFTQTELPRMSYQQAYEEIADKYASEGVDIAEIPEQEFVETMEVEITETMTGEWSLAELTKYVWIVGCVVVGIWFLFTNIRFHHSVLRSRKIFDMNTEAMASNTRELIEECKQKVQIYLCDEVDTPCLFGLFHPVIYLTSETVNDEEVLRHVMIHEITHYIHRDHIWGYARALCLAIHWYNPFVWCAVILARNDAELACDEGAIARLGEKERASYGRTLIGFTCEKTSAVLLTATTMTGSRSSIRERITMITKKPKMKKYVAVLVVIISIFCVGCTFTGADSEDKKLDTNLTTETEDTEIENATIETIIEMPEGLSEEEQEQLRVELELRQQEVERQRELRETMAKFYQVIEKGSLVTDEEVINRIANFLQEENEFDRMMNCEYGYDGTQDTYQMNGRTVFLLEEVTSWEQYEDLASKYYSEEYIENEFTPFFLGNVYIEEDGKLYRTLADGIVNPIIDSTVKVWQAENSKYYVTVTADSAGENYLHGYVLDLSEDSIYGFEIVEKVQLLEGEMNVKEFTYYADLTHDGADECIQVNIVVGSEQEDTQVKISVYNDETLALLYETELLLHPNLGESYYLSTYNGKDYLLRYKSGINHDTASCEYEVFYLGETGEKIVFDIDEIEISLLHVEEIDVDVWKDLAEEENKYFRDAFLLASTIDGRLEYSTDIERITYIEDFGWFILEDTESIERNLELFLEEVREMYDNSKARDKN